MKSLNRRSTGQADTVDGISGERGIATLMASKLENILNTQPSVSRDHLSSSVNSLVSSSQLADIHVTEDKVIDDILSLKPHKSDASDVSTELLKCVIPIVSKPLAALLTTSLRHGYTPKCFQDIVVLPIPKSGKNVSVSDNYHPISLASNFMSTLFLRNTPIISLVMSFSWALRQVLLHLFALALSRILYLDIFTMGLMCWGVF